MLLSKDAIADVVEVCGPAISIGRSQTVYDGVTRSVRQGEPADPSPSPPSWTGAVNSPGRRRALPAHADRSVPTAANAGYYAQMSRSKAVLRRLVEAGDRIVQLGYEPTARRR